MISDYIYDYVFVFLFAFLAVFNLTPLMIKLAIKTNFMDNPEARKMHKQATPLLGGLAVFIGFLSLAVYATIIAKGKTFDRSINGFLLGAALIVLVGLIDDRHGLRPAPKFVGQVISSLIFLYFNNLLTVFGPAYVTVPILLFWLVGLMNAFNFLDNMDGILAGMSGILAFGFYFISYFSKTPFLAEQHHFIALLSLTFAGSVFGFLPYNFNPAKIFLGDTGSMFVGYFLGCLGILVGKLTTSRMNSDFYFLLPVLLLSYAIFDITLVSYTRRRDGRHVMQGGKDHSTHRINNAMGSTKLTAVIVYVINLLIVLISLLVLLSGSITMLVVASLVFSSCFLFFGHKLDKIPVTITKNQLKKS